VYMRWGRNNPQPKTAGQLRVTSSFGSLRGLAKRMQLAGEDCVLTGAGGFVVAWPMGDLCYWGERGRDRRRRQGTLVSAL